VVVESLPVETIGVGTIDLYWRKRVLRINPLKTKRRLRYLKTQSVPRCKHFSFWF